MSDWSDEYRRTRLELERIRRERLEIKETLKALDRARQRREEMQ